MYDPDLSTRDQPERLSWEAVKGLLMAMVLVDLAVTVPIVVIVYSLCHHH